MQYHGNVSVICFLEIHWYLIKGLNACMNFHCIEISWFCPNRLDQKFSLFCWTCFYDDISINRPAVINASILFHHPCFPQQCGSGFGKILVDPDVGSVIKQLNSISNIRINGNVNIGFVIVWGSYIWCLSMLVFLGISVIIIIRVVACWSLRFYWFPPGFSRGAPAMWLLRAAKTLLREP